MGSLRFYRRVHLFPGVSVNLSKSGPSLTLGMRGAHLTMGRKGITRTVGIPGTGIYYTSHDGYHSGFHSAHHDAPLTPEEQARANRQAEISVVILALGIVLVACLLIGALAK
jgi:uncharacterized protein DUF4236